MSASYLESSIPLPLDEEILEDVISKGKDWALMHGACMRLRDNFSMDFLHFVPFVLTPTTFPRREFEKAVHLQTILNELMHWVAHDSEFLKATLANTIQIDEFTRKLYEIFEWTLENGVAQNSISLGLLRSDYLAHSLSENSIKQVEINTIASSFGGISTHIPSLHSYILQELGHQDKLVNLPKNDALAGICGGLIKAWDLQGNPKAVILIVIENITYNICDQKFHEYYIRENRSDIQIIRKTLTEIHKYAILGPNKELIINGVEVSVIYYRSGYDPVQYPTQNEWDARLLMEQSLAIKCPSIQYHLAGTKKVQQALARPGVLDRFLKDKSKVEAIRNIFTGLYSLDNTPEGEESVKMALENPEKYVLKPQREGGGNNIYGVDIPEALKNMSESERPAWILMERIFPPLSKGYMIRPNQPFPPQIVDLVSELGIFGAIIGDKNNIFYNKQAGHMLRTKLSSANEGGVAAGYGALDSPCLFD